MGDFSEWEAYMKAISIIGGPMPRAQKGLKDDAVSERVLVPLGVNGENDFPEFAFVFGNEDDDCFYTQAEIVDRSHGKPIYRRFKLGGASFVHGVTFQRYSELRKVLKEFGSLEEYWVRKFKV